MSRSYLSALVGGLTAQFFSAQTGQGMYGSDPAASVQINTMRPALTTQQLEAWAAHTIYARLSGALPGSAMAGGMTVAVLNPQGKADADTTAELQTAIDDALMRLKVLEALRYSLRDGVGGLWLLDATVKDQREPLDPETARISQIHALSRFDMTPAGEVISDAASPFYGWPEFVKVAPRMGNRRAEPVVCHISRVLCVAGLKPISTYNKTQDEWDGYGRPLCSMLGDSIKYAETGVITGAGLVQRIQQRVLKLNPKTMSEAKVNRTLRELIEARVALMAETQSTQGVVMLMQDETFEAVNARVEGFDSLVKTLTDHLVMQWGIPRAIVTGEQVGGLTASSAPYMDAWGLRVNAYRGEISPAIEYVARCLLSTIGAPGSNFRVEWAALTPANALTEAQAQGAKAQTAAVLVQSGVLGAETAAEWLRSQGVDLPEDQAQTFGEEGEQIAAAIGEQGEPAAVDPAAAVSAEGVAPVTAEPKEPFPVGFVSAALEAAKAVKSGEVNAAQVRGILKSMMGVDPAGAEEIAPDSAAPTGVTPPQNGQSNSATDAAPADSLWIGAVPAADGWEQRLAPIRAAVAEILPGFEPDADPHLTVMYLGAVAADVVDLAVDEAQRAVRRFTAEANDQPGELPAFHGARVALMAPQDDGRRAVAVSGEAWGLYQVRDDLQAALGEMIAPDVRRFPWRPHVTLGYATAEITPAQRERLAVVVEAPIVLPIAQVTVRADRETPLAVLKTFDAAAEIAPPEVRVAARAVLAARDNAGPGIYAPAVWAALHPVARGEPVNAALLRSLAGSSAPGAAWAQGIVDAPAE